MQEARQLARQQLATQLINPSDQQAAQILLHKRLFARFDAALDRCQEGARWLEQPLIAVTVATEILRLAELGTVVQCFCIMPNHVHLLVQLPEDNDFSFVKMMQLLKGRTSVTANRLLGRTGQAFWQPESYDHLVRSAGEAERVAAYILNNPIKAGLAGGWQSWPFSYRAA